MAGFVARHWRIGALLSCVTFVALPLSSAGAATASFKEVVVGPLTTAHGYKVEVTVDCNSKGGEFGQLAVTKGGHHYALSYTYYPRHGRKTTCTASRKLGSGSMTVRWGAALSGKLKFGHAGSLKPINEKGCKGPVGHLRKVKGTGTLKMSIHSRAFGKLVIHKAPAELQKYNENLTCTGGPSGGATDLFANWDRFRRGVSAFRTPRGHRLVSVFVEDDAPAVTGSMDDEFTGGAKLFSFKSNLGSAHIGSLSPLLTGGLTYTATGSCGPGYTTGTLKGKLVVHDPVLGTVRFVGKKATKLYGGPSLESSGSGCTTP